MASLTDNTAQRKLPAEFDTLFRSGSYEKPPQEVQHSYAKTIESTRILPVKRRLGVAILRRLARIRPSEAVAFAAVFAIGVDAGVMWGISLQDGVSPNQNRTQIAGPEKPGESEQDPKNPQKDPAKSRDEHGNDKNASNQHESVKSIDITNSENVAKAIADNENTTTKATAAPSEESESTSSPEATPQTTEPEADPETQEPTPSDTPTPTESSPTPTETAPDPDPTSEAPSPQSTETEPKSTPAPQESAATPTATAQEVTPTLEGAGSGTATAMPSSIMSTLVAIQQ